MKKNESRSYHQNSNYVLFPPANGRGHTVLPWFGILFYHHSIIINFLFIISAVVACTHSTKFGLWMFHKNMHVNFKFGPGPMMFNRVKECINYYVEIAQNTDWNTGQVQVRSYDFFRVMPLELRKKQNKSFVQTNVKLNVAWQPAGHIWFLWVKSFFRLVDHLSYQYI